jgi:hypothetical protein
LPVGLKKIGSSAFEKCVALTSVVINAPLPPKISKNTFKGVTGACVLHVPRGCKLGYQQEKIWGPAFSQIEEVQLVPLKSEGVK